MFIKELLHYDISGVFFLLKDNKPYRKIFPDEDGYLKFYRKGKKYKLKANRVAYELTHGVQIPENKVVLHRNLDPDDYRLQNLKLVSREVFNQIKEAHRNLSSLLKILPHPTDVFSYVVHWREKGKDKMQVVQDVVIARRLYVKLQLKYAKILSKYCVFDI